MRRMSLPLAAVALLSCAVTLVSLSSLQQQCGHTPDSQQLHIIDETSGDVMDVTSAVYGAGSLQGVSGFSADIHTCSSVYRFQWFVSVFELVAVVGLLACGGEMCYRQMRFSFLGLFAILALLFIQMTDSFLTASNVAYYREVPQAQRSLQDMIGGCVATSALNLLLVFTLGSRCGGGGGGWSACRAARAARAAALEAKQMPLIEV